MGVPSDTDSFEAIGTHWQIDIPGPRAEDARALLFGEIKQRIEKFDCNYSRFRADSLVSKMSRTAGTYLLPEDAEIMIRLYEKVYRLTEGAFTPLIGSALEEAGYDAVYSLTPRQLHKPLSWEEAIEFNPPSLTIKKPLVLDFGAAGKGYCIDLVGALLEAHGIRSFTIDAGGDILHAGSNAIRVGLEHPQNQKQVIGVYELKKGSICCSAGNRRAWQGFHHIIDPHTLASPQNILAVWVTAATALHADAMATALFLVSPRMLIGHFEFEYCILYPDYSIEKSDGFSAEIFG